MIKQREQRCGKVIWKTLVQLLYMGLYLYVIFNRNNITAMQQHNSDIDQIVTKSRYMDDEGRVIVMDEIDFSSYMKLIDFLKLMDQNLLLEKNTTITSEVDVTAAKIANLYYLMNEKNYIVLQGSTYCINILLHKFDADGKISERIQYDVQVPYSKDLKSKFDEEAFDGTGGICFNIFHQDPGFPSEELIRVM